MQHSGHLGNNFRYELLVSIFLICFISGIIIRVSIYSKNLIRAIGKILRMTFSKYIY